MCWAHVKMNYIVCTLQIPNRAINLEKCSTPRWLSFIFCKHVHHCGDMCFICKDSEGKEDASMEDRENTYRSSNRSFPPMQMCVHVFTAIFAYFPPSVSYSSDDTRWWGPCTPSPIHAALALHRIDRPTLHKSANVQRVWRMKGPKMG